MTEQEADAAHELYLRVSQAIDELVNLMTDGVSPEADEYVRTLLLETQRYWRET